MLHYLFLLFLLGLYFLFHFWLRFFSLLHRWPTMHAPLIFVTSTEVLNTHDLVLLMGSDCNAADLVPLAKEVLTMATARHTIVNQ